MADWPRTFEEIVAAEDPAERERWRRAGWFTDPRAKAGDFHASVTVIEDQARNGEWRVEHSDNGGGCYVTLFAGPEAERRARDYFQALKSGAVKIVREGATEH
jgi:hypothetical protein